MTILSVCQEASTVIGLAYPSQVFGSTEQEAVELAALANEMGARIARAAEWQALTRLRTLSGSDDDRPLPEDFDRFVRDGGLRSNMWGGAKLRHVVSRDEWLQLTLLPLNASPPVWTLRENEIHFLPAPQADEEISFYYISNLWAQTTGGDNQASFMTDDDVFRLNERTLKLGMIAQWRANKGMDMEPHASVASQALAEDILRDQGPRTIEVGRPTTFRGVDLAYPLTITP